MRALLECMLCLQKLARQTASLLPALRCVGVFGEVVTKGKGGGGATATAEGLKCPFSVEGRVSFLLGLANVFPFLHRCVYVCAKQRREGGRARHHNALRVLIRHVLKLKR